MQYYNLYNTAAIQYYISKSGVRVLVLSYVKKCIPFCARHPAANVALENRGNMRVFTKPGVARAVLHTCPIPYIKVHIAM